MIDYIQILKNAEDGAKDDRIIFSNMNKELSIDDISRSCEALIHHLRISKIQVLALYADNSVDWVVTDLACQKAGIVLLPLPVFFSGTQLEHALSSCKVDAILTDDPTRLEELLNKQCLRQTAIPDLSLRFCVFDIVAECNLDCDLEYSLLPDETGKITFTSGSTGRPKGVCLSNAQLQRQAEVLAQTVGLKMPRHLCLLPLSTLLENVAGVYAPLLAEGKIIIPKLSALGFDGSAMADQTKFLAMISSVQPDSIILIPQLLLLLVFAIKSGWQAPESLKFVAVGGSKVSKELLTEARTLGIPVYEGYGLSECASVVSLNTVEHDKPGSCGKPLTNVDVTIVDGEVLVSGNAMLGYVNEPESWRLDTVKTGDLGIIDDEGFLHIEGRKKNLLISSYGRNISPEWVESELLASPMIVEAVIFGDALPYCTALITVRSNEIPDTEIQGSIDAINAALPDYARVINWHRLSFPLASNKKFMTENGRPRRNIIAESYNAEIAALYSPGQKNNKHEYLKTA